MKPIKDIRVMIVDKGQFVEIARRMAVDCKEVLYCYPSERCMPLLAEGIVGDGIEGVTRVESIWDDDEVDLYVFPDVGFSSEQKELIRRGKPVWGARDADKLETNRGLFCKTLESLDMPVTDYKTIKGMTNLKLFLKDKEDKYIKISKWRGDMETFHWTSWKENEIELDRLAIRFGAAKEGIKFYVFDPIDADIEDGIDAYCVDGKFPSLVLHGMEAKDRSYIGAMQKWDDLPEEVRSVNEKFSPVLKEYGYRAMFCTEVRITEKDESYFIDPTCRFPSPPFQVMLDLFGNFSEIIWQGANGNLIDPEPTAKIGVQALLKMDKAADDWGVAEIPDSIKGQVKGCFNCEINGAMVFPPSPMADMAAWLTATGDTIEEAIKTLQEYKADLPDVFECQDKSLADLLVEIQKAEDKGMQFTSESIPSPSIVLEEK